MPLAWRMAPLWTVVATIGCTDSPRLKTLTDPPHGSPMVSMADIVLPPDVWASDVVGVEGCDLVVASHRSGAVTRLSPTGLLVDAWYPSGRRIGTRLDRSGEDFLVASSERPESLGLIALDQMAYREWVVPAHPWGGVMVGSVAGVDSVRVAVAPVAGRIERRQPDPWVEAPLFSMVDETGRRIADVDSVRFVPGTFLAWRRSRIALGALRERMMVVDLSTGTISTFSLRTGAKTESGTMRLYMESPPPREEVWTPAWIHEGADLRSFFDVPQVLAAGFSPDGLIYAIRPYEVVWRPGRNAYTATQGAWRTTRRGLEVYDVRGKRLGAFQLPGAVRAPSWISVDGLGRVFMPDTAGGVHVVSDPMMSDAPCAVPIGVVVVDSATIH